MARKSTPQSSRITLGLPEDTREIERSRLRSADDRLDRSVRISNQNSRYRDASAETSEHLATFGARTIISGRNATPPPCVPSAPWTSTARLSGACSKPFEAGRRRREAGQSTDRGPRTGPGRRSAGFVRGRRRAAPATSDPGQGDDTRECREHAEREGGTGHGPDGRWKAPCARCSCTRPTATRSGRLGSIRIDPGASGRGLSLTVAPAWSAAGSNVEGLLGLTHA